MKIITKSANLETKLTNKVTGVYCVIYTNKNKYEPKWMFKIRHYCKVKIKKFSLKINSK